MNSFNKTRETDDQNQTLQQQMENASFRTDESYENGTRLSVDDYSQHGDTTPNANTKTNANTNTKNAVFLESYLDLAYDDDDEISEEEDNNHGPAEGSDHLTMLFEPHNI